MHIKASGWDLIIEKCWKDYYWIIRRIVPKSADRCPNHNGGETGQPFEKTSSYGLISLLPVLKSKMFEKH